MIDRLQAVRGNLQAHRAAEHVGHQGDVEKVRQEAPLGLDVRVADSVARHRAFARQIATTRHGKPQNSLKIAMLAGAGGAQNSLLFWTADV